MMKRAIIFRREPLTDENQFRLERACATFRDRLYVMTLLDTGLRVSEFAGLTAEACRLTQDPPDIRVVGKGQRVRFVPATLRVRDLLTRYFATVPAIGVTKRTVQNVIAEVAHRAALTQPCSPHVLRHTFAVRCLRCGLNPRTVQQLLGHSSILTTEIYLNQSNLDALREFYAKME